MRIQNITSKIYFNKQIKTSSQDNQRDTKSFATIPFQTTFEARVDKGLTRFYEANADRMPLTVKTYIEKLVDKSSKTPLQAQATAFAALASISTVAGIKADFEKEELFKELKEPSETKATRGILGVFRENKELLELCNQSVLNSGESLTVWLVKKIFLEGKTIEEINKDFKKEVNNEFKTLYLQKEKGEEPIKSSTLKALGIKTPEFEYQQSLRYTRDGYSDLVGEKISQAQKDFYASLPIEERTARARRSVEKFENWWNSMTRNEQLDIIAEQIDELEMLKKFNTSEYGKINRTAKTKEISNIETPQPIEKNKVKIDSGLSRDDLFKIWAGNNLKLFKENLTEYDKIRIETKREQHRAEWWNSMTPKERTDYINKLRISVEPLKFAMMDAWNKNPEILIELSHFLKKFHFEKPTDILYGTKDFNNLFSDAMTNFWNANPDFAEKLGASIKDSHEKIKDAMNNGNFEIIKRDITQERIKREKEISESLKNYREILSDEIYENYPEYMKDFIDTYSNSEGVNTKLLPIKYIQDYYNIVATELPQEVTESWTKALRKETLSKVDETNLTKIRNMESRKTAIISRALEATLADVLYECTSDPQVYLLSHADCKMAIKQISDGRENITIFSHKTNRSFDIPIKNRNIDAKKIDELYESYIKPLPEYYIDSVIDQFIEINFNKIKTIQEKANLIDYLSSYLEEYNHSLNILFDNASKHTPEAKAYFATKVINNMANDIDLSSFTLKTRTVEDFNREDQLHRICNYMHKKYSFLPKDAFSMYIYELNKVLRNAKQNEIDNYEKNCCVAKKTSSDHSRIILMNRKTFTPTHKVFSLCLEQALADLIYESCGNEEVYAFQMEELLSYMEAIMLVKKFPVKETAKICTSLGKEVEIKPKHRIQPYQIEKKFREYYDEMVNYINECINESKNLSKEDILYILNPDENKTRTDELTKIRINNSIDGELMPH